MNNKFKAQSLNRKSYRIFTSCCSVTCFKHVGLLWTISPLDRKQVRGYAFWCPTWMRYIWANWRVPIQTYGHQTTLYISLNSTGEYVCIFEYIQYMHVNSRIYIFYTCDAYRYAGMCIHTMSACVFVLKHMGEYIAWYGGWVWIGLHLFNDTCLPGHISHPSQVGFSHNWLSSIDCRIWWCYYG